MKSQCAWCGKEGKDRYPLEDIGKTHTICFSCLCKEKGLADEQSRLVLAKQIKRELVWRVAEVSNEDELRNIALSISEIEADFKCKGGVENEYCNNDKRPNL